ncbi:MAG: maltotransferase domain-containing protein, partial [Flavobacterium sp.]
MQNQTRIIIENVMPQLNGGMHFIKRIIGQEVAVHADVFADGHDVIACCVKYKHESDKTWQEVRMCPSYNEEWNASFKLDKQGFYTYFIEGWVDNALNWQHGIGRKISDYQFVTSELLEGIGFIEDIIKNVDVSEKEYLNKILQYFKNEAEYDQAIEEAVS